MQDNIDCKLGGPSMALLCQTAPNPNPEVHHISTDISRSTFGEKQHGDSGYLKIGGFTYLIVEVTVCGREKDIELQAHCIEPSSHQGQRQCRQTGRWASSPAHSRISDCDSRHILCYCIHSVLVLSAAFGGSQLLCYSCSVPGMQGHGREHHQALL